MASGGGQGIQGPAEMTAMGAASSSTPDREHGNGIVEVSPRFVQLRPRIQCVVSHSFDRLSLEGLRSGEIWDTRPDTCFQAHHNFIVILMPATRSSRWEIGQLRVRKVYK